MCCRFVSLLQQKHDDDVILIAQQQLVPLLRESHLLSNTFERAMGIPKGTNWAPLMNLIPIFCKPNHPVPMREGYLKVCEKRIAHWRDKIQRRSDLLLIALHWQGNPDQDPAGHISIQSLCEVIGVLKPHLMPPIS